MRDRGVLGEFCTILLRPLMFLMFVLVLLSLPIEPRPSMLSDPCSVHVDTSRQIHFHSRVPQSLMLSQRCITITVYSLIPINATPQFLHMPCTQRSRQIHKFMSPHMQRLNHRSTSTIASSSSLAFFNFFFSLASLLFPLLISSSCNLSLSAANC